jgi:dihydromethanopterin reductase (acceptor)
MKRIAWGITGAGHLLNECTNLLTQFDLLDIFLSRAAEEVVRMYDVEAKLVHSGARVYAESKTLISTPVVARLFQGKYSLLLVAPATSNTVAKFVYGLSDTLITNLFAQAGKSRVPIVVLPTDIAPEMDSVGPKGGLVKVYPRAIDLENTARLRRFPGVTVVSDMRELEACLNEHLRAVELEESSR